MTARAARIMRDMLMRGFTTVRDAGGADHGLVQEEGLIEGPRVFHCGFGLSQTGGHGDFRSLAADIARGRGEHLPVAGIGRIADGVDAVRRAARDEIRKGAKHIKIMASGGVASPADPIHYTQFSRDEISAAVEEAEAAGTYGMAHAYTPKAIIRAVECGVRTIEHGNLIDDEAARLMAERDAFLVPTNITYHALSRHGREYGFPEDSLAKLQRIVDAGLEGVATARRAGVRIGYGTDLLGEMHRYQSDEFTLRAEGEDPVDVLRSATIENAAILGRSGELGEIAPGALADLLVLDGNPLEDLGLLGEQGAHLSIILQGGLVRKGALG